MPHPKPKKVILYKASGGELANQLWNYVSVKAYCLEKGFELENYSFYEYASFFRMPATKNMLINSIFFKPLENHIGRKWSLQKRIWRKLYQQDVLWINILHRTRIVSLNDKKTEVLYLPPSPAAQNPSSLAKRAELQTLEDDTASTIYLSGWLFRNPWGLKKYRAELVEYFRPKEWVEKIAEDFIAPLKAKYPHVIGVHIRQGDYKHWKGGAYFIEQSRVREILEEYLSEYKLLAKDTCFIIASDGHIDKAAFAGLNIAPTEKSMVEDLFILSRTDTVIGSDSTFGDFAAWYGNVPHIIFQKEKMDWRYYHEQPKEFFENIYCSWVHY